MPLTRIELIQVSLLLLCVPAQYFLSKHFGINSDSQRTYALKSFLSSLSDFKTKYLQWHTWLRWCLELPLLTNRFRNLSKREATSDGESPAVEVVRYRGGKSGYFAESLTIRSPRPRTVRFRIGQVVRNKRGDYHGVIIGWDSEAIAPQSWLNKHYPINEIMNYLSIPHYLILVDERDRSTPRRTYESEENLIPIKDTKINHQSLDDYFDAFDGAQYIPRHSLRILYPDD